MNTFGERLISERKKSGYNQKEFAAAIGITPTRLNYWEKDKREPDFPHIQKIVDLLGCNADYLIGTKFSTATVDLDLDEQELIKKYRALDERGKLNVDRTLDNEYEYLISKEKEKSNLLSS